MLGINDSDEPKFITSAYKKKLMEEQRWDYEDRLNDEVERRNDVTKKDGMSGFYAGLLTKNIAYGGDLSAATSAYTAGSVRQAQYMADGVGDSVDAAPAPTDSRKRSVSDEVPVEINGDPETAEVPVELTGPTAQADVVAVAVSEEEQRRLQALHREEALAAAKARFLERKKQKTT